MTFFEDTKQRTAGDSPETPSPETESLQTSFSARDFREQAYLGPDALAEKQLEVMAELKHILESQDISPTRLVAALRRSGQISMNQLADSETLRDAQVSLCPETGDILIIPDSTMAEFRIRVAQLAETYSVVDMHPDYTDNLREPAGLAALIPQSSERRFTMTLSSGTKPEDVLDLSLANSQTSSKPAAYQHGSVLSRDLRREYDPLVDNELLDRDELKEAREHLFPPSLIPGSIAGANVYENTVLFEDDNEEDEDKKD